MNARMPAAAAVLALLVVVGCGSGTPDLAVDDVRTPEPASPDVAAVYLTVRNAGDGDDRLVGARTDVAGRVELHESIVEDGIARMVEVTGGLDVPAGGALVLEQGGYHVMLLDLHAPLGLGDRFTLTLDFADSGAITVEVPVVARDAHGHDDAGHEDGHGAADDS